MVTIRQNLDIAASGRLSMIGCYVIMGDVRRGKGLAEGIPNDAINGFRLMGHQRPQDAVRTQDSVPGKPTWQSKQPELHAVAIMITAAHGIAGKGGRRQERRQYSEGSAAQFF